MMDIVSQKQTTGMLAIVLIVCSTMLFWACDNSSDTSSPQSQSITLDLGLPNSLTGGTPASASLQSSDVSTRSGTGMPCVYLGSEDDDPFRNGYEMTKFMVSAVAAWISILTWIKKRSTCSSGLMTAMNGLRACAST